ncbi:MAG TPA: histidine kinase dimerization/phospho-acceptor domain-containing protein, partial [Polyangiaceae bacterium]|nr:histidine kinase dimerization/phospho-acceptor domain-containing protein [Polyangiaceae bacterium]
MDLRTRTSLFCGALALAIAVSMLLRGKPQRPQWFFAAFSADIGLWYLAQWLYLLQLSPIWAHFTAVLVVSMPQFAVHLFRALVPRKGGGQTLTRVAGALFFPMLLLVLSPEHTASWVRGAVILYVFGLFAAGLWSLWRRGETSGSRSTQKRVRFVVAIGAVATAFSLADFLWFVGVQLPPVGAVLSIVFLFVLSESLIRERLVDLYEMAGLAVVSTALAFSLGGIFYVFVQVLGQFQTMYLNAVLGGIVMLMLFDPLRDKLTAYLHRSFFLERVDLERAIERTRQELTHVLQVERMTAVVINALADSHRATAAALYLYPPLAVDFELASSFGDKPPRRIPSAGIRALAERLGKSQSLGLEEVERRLDERRRASGQQDPSGDEQVLREAELLGPYRRGVIVALRARGGELLGLLALVDERVSDAFSAEERALLEVLARQISVVLENSRRYLQMQAQARLAALGQMAAGLAHEVKNPLSAIKGAAQLLGEPTLGRPLDETSSEFLGIILEEVERLDRVVRSVLDYARPKQGDPGLISVNAVVDQTLRLLASDREGGCQYATELDARLPQVQADAEQLRQVLLNLIRNAAEAMGGRGT